MQSKLIYLLVFALTTLTQIVPNPTSLASVPKTSNSSLNESQNVLQYLFRSYSQLRDYNKTFQSSSSRNSSHKTQLQDFFFTFQLNQSRVSVIATLSLSSPGEFISISPVVTIEGDNFTSSGSENQNSNYFIISNHDVKVVNTNRTTNARPLGSFQPFTDRNDNRLDLALAFLESLHPQMVNYRLEAVEYQVVSGINFLLVFAGNDELTTLRAMVNVDLNSEPNLWAFFVHCTKTNNTVFSMPCSNTLAFQVFVAIEALLIMHPELMNYELISMVSDDSYVSDGILFVLTFENFKEKTRVMVELNINGNQFSKLAYYIYSYPQ